MRPQTDILIIGVGGSGCSAVAALAAADWPERPLAGGDTEARCVAGLRCAVYANWQTLSNE